MHSTVPAAVAVVVVVGNTRAQVYLGSVEGLRWTWAFFVSKRCDDDGDGIYEVQACACVCVRVCVCVYVSVS